MNERMKQEMERTVEDMAAMLPEQNRRGRYGKSIKIVAVIAAILATAISISVSVYGIAKLKNRFQLAAERGDIQSVVEHEDFRYSPTAEPETVLPGGQEIFTDDKTEIYAKMLNSIDYMNNVSAVMETSMLSDEKTEVIYQFDINERIAYQAEYRGSLLHTETYADGRNMLFVDHNTQTFVRQYLPVYGREDTPYIPLAERIVTGEDGIPVSCYRRNVTNCYLADYCLVPQALAMSYLKDFDNWELTGYESYLERDCAVINGTSTPYFNGKHNGIEFVMTVDTETGVLMKFELYRDDALTNYSTVISISYETNTAVPTLDFSVLKNYTEQP